MLNAAGQHARAGCARLAHGARGVARFRVRAIQPLAAEVLHAGGPVHLVEQYPGGEGVELDLQPARIPALDVQQPLARSHTRMVVRGHRRVAETDRAFRDHAPVVGILLAFDSRAIAERSRRPRSQRVFGRLQNRSPQIAVLERRQRNCAFGRQPPAPAVAAGISPELAEHPFPPPVPAVLDSLEVGAHVIRAPGRIAGDVGDLIPVGVMRVDEDHRVVRRAPAERAGARVQDTVHLALVERGAELLVLVLAGIVLVVPDEEIPSQRFVLGRERVKRGNVVVFGQGVLARILRVGALELTRIAAGLEQEHPEPQLREPRGDSPAAGARADDDGFGVEVGGGVLARYGGAEAGERAGRRRTGDGLPTGKPGGKRETSFDEFAAVHGQNVFTKAMSARLSASLSPGSSPIRFVPK